ncbi:MAG: protein-L-isoaspartate(D-aspartate) O-methyltransferase [Planctomycetota bacterium]|jgi:protein-L-isoaspartate(D-aspartate) O-methyltransferase
MRRARVLLLALAVGACGGEGDEAGEAPPARAASHEAARASMVDETLATRGLHNARVLQAMRTVPRHEFVPEEHRRYAYEDRSLPIGHDQTISPPYIVAIMAEVAAIGPQHNVLEIGTGSGYGAAVLAELANEVYTIEILEPLAKQAERNLHRLGYRNVHVRHGDGYQGWPDAAPFDAIVVTAAPREVPEPLKAQLKVGGRLVVPVGDRIQYLRVLTRTKDGTFLEDPLFEVRFVPMTGEAQRK